MKVSVPEISIWVKFFIDYNHNPKIRYPDNRELDAVLPDDNGRNPFFQKLKIRINPYAHKSV